MVDELFFPLLLRRSQLLYAFSLNRCRPGGLSTLTRFVAALDASFTGKPAEAEIKRFPAKRPKTTVDPRSVAEDTLKRYPRTMARLAE